MPSVIGLSQSASLENLFFVAESGAHHLRGFAQAAE